VGLSLLGPVKVWLSWIKLLYASPMDSVQTNKIKSEYFRLTRSTRQGCPLSPLLFALATSCGLLTGCKRIQWGIHRGVKEHKISLFADDLLIYISDPSKSTPQ